LTGKECPADGSFKADYGRDDGIPGYAWVSRYTLAFLDAYLRHDRAAMDWLRKTRAENGVLSIFCPLIFVQPKDCRPPSKRFARNWGAKDSIARAKSTRR
jgi:hypothetical protein